MRKNNLEYWQARYTLIKDSNRMLKEKNKILDSLLKDCLLALNEKPNFYFYDHNGNKMRSYGLASKIDKHFNKEND